MYSSLDCERRNMLLILNLFRIKEEDLSISLKLTLRELHKLCAKLREDRLVRMYGCAHHYYYQLFHQLTIYAQYPEAGSASTGPKSGTKDILLHRLQAIR